MASGGSPAWPSAPVPLPPMAEVAAPSTAPVDAQPRLDELMLAMDVVDTLRHEEGLAEKELGQDSRDAALKSRLRQLYEGQGLDVSDRILDEGIRALKESRFVYTPAPPSLRRTLATLWVRRGRYGKVAGLLVLLVAALLAWRIFERRSTRLAEQQAQP